MKNKLTKLINVKSIVTILSSIVFAIMTLSGKLSSQEFMNIFTVIIAFYFGTQVEKRDENE